MTKLTDQSVRDIYDHSLPCYGKKLCQSSDTTAIMTDNKTVIAARLQEEAADSANSMLPKETKVTKKE